MSSLEESAVLVASRTRRLLHPLVEGRLWTLKTGIFASALALFLQSPVMFETRGFWPFLERQSHHLLDPALTVPGSHQSKLAFRVVPPLLVSVLHLSKNEYFVLQGALGVLSLAMLAGLFARVGLTRFESMTLVVAAATTYLGAAWFVDSHPVCDAIAVTALLCAMAVRNPILVFVAITAAVWTDERAILAALVVAVFHVSERRKLGGWAVGTALVAYGLVRLWLANRYGLRTDHNAVGLPVLREYLFTAPIALATALEGLWAVLAIGLAAGVVARTPGARSVLLAAVASTGTAAMVIDVTRSTVYLMPAIVVSAGYLTYERTTARRWVLGLAAVACVVFPTTHVIGHAFQFLAPLPVRLLVNSP